MSTAIAVYHGLFGRAAIYHLDRSMVRHTHREAHLIFHVDGPPSEMHVADNRCEISPDAGVGVNPWEAHNYDAPDRRPGHPRPGVVILVIYINPAWFAQHSACSTTALRFYSPRIAVDPPLHALISRVVESLREGGPAINFDGLLFEFTELCVRQSQHGSQLSQTVPRVSDFRIRRSLQLISSAAVSELDLADVALQSGLSRPHFFKLFHDQVGVPPRLFWNMLRMERALNALTRTAAPITQIGLDLGFASSSSFSRFFTLNVGLPPTDYRRVARVLAA